MIVLLVFWILIFLVVYTYFLYPLLMLIISRLKKHSKNQIEGKFLPRISLIIPAYNEEQYIREKVENSLSVFQSYQGEYEILIGSDGSTDNTNDYLSDYEDDKKLKIFKFRKRRGKIAVLNNLVEVSNGEILIFTDSGTLFEVGLLEKLVPYFSNKEIGGVGGAKKVRELSKENNVKRQEGIYWKLEEITKIGESRLGKLVGADGPLFAIRKEKFKAFPDDTILDDFVISSYVAKKSKKFIYDSTLAAYEEPSGTYEDERKRRVRMASGAYQALMNFSFLFFPIDKFTFLFISHKVIRWLSPIILICAFVLNIFLVSIHTFYAYILLLQSVIYVVTCLTHFIPYLRNNKLLSFIYYFISSIFIQLYGLFNIIKKSSANSSVLWDKTKK
jgi:cellulose synthase/poly-beta-1,6-N-acetylglucosamine synthase-like glycosyltransferase